MRHNQNELKFLWDANSPYTIEINGNELRTPQFRIKKIETSPCTKDPNYQSGSISTLLSVSGRILFWKILKIQVIQVVLEEDDENRINAFSPSHFTWRTVLKKLYFFKIIYWQWSTLVLESHFICNEILDFILSIHTSHRHVWWFYHG